jgi:hypothetical protein
MLLYNTLDFKTVPFFWGIISFFSTEVVDRLASQPKEGWLKKAWSLFETTDFYLGRGS